MGLGETKRKTRLVGSAVARNAAWTNDASLPGQRMLSSMGWSQGQGLGSSSQGTAVPIAMAFKMDNKGIGARRFEKEAKASGKGDAWIGGGGELGDLFERLNKASSSDAAEGQTEGREEKEREGRKSKKRDTKGKGKSRGDDQGGGEGEEEKQADAVVVEEAVRKVASSLPHRMAHRARFLRAKRMVGSDLASVNEILGIASPSGSSSPAPAEAQSAAQVEPVEEEKMETKEDVAGEKDGKREKGKRKREKEKEMGESASEKAERKRARKEGKRLAKEEKGEKRKKKEQKEKSGEGDGVSLPRLDPSTDPSFAAGGGMKVSSMSVQDYLQNKLMLRRAALIRRRREEREEEEGGIWKRAAMVTA